MCSGGNTHMQWWKYSCAVVDMFMSRAGQLKICSCAVVVNVGYAHMQWWSMFDMLMCIAGQWWI